MFARRRVVHGKMLKLRSDVLVDFLSHGEVRRQTPFGEAESPTKAPATRWVFSSLGPSDSSIKPGCCLLDDSEFAFPNAFNGEWCEQRYHQTSELQIGILKHYWRVINISLGKCKTTSSFHNKSPSLNNMESYAVMCTGDRNHGIKPETSTKILLTTFPARLLLPSRCNVVSRRWRKAIENSMRSRKYKKTPKSRRVYRVMEEKNMRMRIRIITVRNTHTRITL